MIALTLFASLGLKLGIREIISTSDKYNAIASNDIYEGSLHNGEEDSSWKTA
jgi:hypothetical protein